MFRTLIRAILISISITAAPGVGAQTTKVDLMLVLASDVSRSINNEELKLQREGYAAAITHPHVLDAISAGFLGRIAVTYLEWAGPWEQRVVVDWTLIDGAAPAQRFADQLIESPRSFNGKTSIAGAIYRSLVLLKTAPYSARRWTIDISGDGTDNGGRDITKARDEALAEGAVVNGLVILSSGPIPWNPEHTHPPGGLEKYYRDNVIGGPSSFVVVAKDFASFSDAILKKMIAEIASR